MSTGECQDDAAERVDLALSYLRAGLGVLPIRPDGTKAPALPSGHPYLHQRPDEATVRSWFDGQPRGIAIPGGPVSGYLETLDFERESVFRAWEQLVEVQVTGLVRRLCLSRTPGRYGERGVHARYCCPGVTLRTQVLARTEDNETAIETRGEGSYAIAPGSPPSCHELGGRWEYLGGPQLPAVPTLTSFERDVLLGTARSLNAFVPEADRKAAGHGLLPGDDFSQRGPDWAEILEPHGWTLVSTRGGARYWRRPGKDHSISATTGVCRSGGVDLLHVFTTSSCELKPGSYSKFRAYAQLNHSGDLKATAKELRQQGYGEQPPASKGAAHPVVSAANADDLSWKPFPVHALPAPIRGFVEGGSQALGCDPSYLALPLLAATAGVLGNVVRLQLKRSWLVPPTLWCAVVAESGSLKTPAMRLALTALLKRQETALIRHAVNAQRHEADVALWDRCMATWKKNKAEVPPPEKPVPPEAERFVVNDVTVEALAPILLENPRGLLLVRDELSGWLGSFGRYSTTGSSGADLAAWLSMHSAENIIVDRKTGAQRTIFVPRAAVSIIAGIQPGILKRSFGPEHREAGLLARFLLASPPRETKHWTEADIDSRLEEEVGNLFDSLLALQPETDSEGKPRPSVVQLSPEAKLAWVAFFDQHAAELADMSGDLAASWSKLEEAGGRLALTIHCVRLAANDPRLSSASVLDEESMNAAITLAGWFKREARRAYAMLSESDADRDRRRLTEWIARNGGTVTAREVQQGCRWLKDAGLAEEALERLAKAGFGSWELSSSTPSGGRPKRIFTLSTPSTSTKP